MIFIKGKNMQAIFCNPLYSIYRYLDCFFELKKYLKNWNFLSFCLFLFYIKHWNYEDMVFDK